MLSAARFSGGNCRALAQRSGYMSVSELEFCSVFIVGLIGSAFELGASV